MKTPFIYSSDSKAITPVTFSLFLGITCLIAAEFIPISLLTPIAKELNISNGLAGQTVTAVGIMAFISSICISALLPKTDRKTLLLSYLAVLVVSNLLIAFCSNVWTLFIGRILLGFCVGGFWSMSNAVIQRLVKKEKLPQTFSLVFSGVSFATIVALPGASYLGSIVSWRYVFIVSAGVSMFAFIWQFLTLPSIKPNQSIGFSHMLELLTQKTMILGMLATFLSYSGYHIVFTYIRIFLEADLEQSSVSIGSCMLIYAIANVIGTLAAGKLGSISFKKTFLWLPLFMLTCPLLMLITGQDLLSVPILFLYAFGFGMIPVMWSLWMINTYPHATESAGGISVAIIQLSIGLAANLGGILCDHLPLESILIVAVIIQFMYFITARMSLPHPKLFMASATN